MTKLIIIRGNSGSGKSTIAKKIRAGSSSKTALIEQDYLRRTVLKDRDKLGADNVDLIFQTVQFCLSRGYHVVLEGILYTGHYLDMIKNLLKQHKRENYIYYLDIPLAETLKRHKTKPNAHEFGAKEMKSWYKDQDLTGLAGEIVLGSDLSEDEIVQRILSETGL